MANLAEMLKRQQQQTTPTNQESNGNGSIDSKSDRAIQDKPTENASAERAASVESQQVSSAKVEASAPGTSKPSLGGIKLGKPGGLKLGGLKLGNSGGSSGVGNESTQESAGKRDDGGSVSTARIRSADEKKGAASSGLSLTDIAGLTSDSGELIIVDDDEEGYLDQVPATAPARELPEELTEQQAAFVKSLDSIYMLHKEPDLFVDVVGKIMSDMAENPALVSLLADEDSNAMIRGLRQSAGMAQVKKQESKAKRGSSSKKNDAKLDEALATLQGLAGFNLD